MKIWIRFVLYSVLGLLFFSVFCLVTLPFFLLTFSPEGAWEISLDLNTPETLVLAGSLVFCFVSAGLLFSLFLVVPLFQLIARIQRIEAKESGSDFPQQSARGRNGGKIAGFLFREVSTSIEHLERRLEFAEKERQQTEDAKRIWLEGVTHDLKTPLSYITGYSSLLLTPKHSFEKEEMQQYHATIYDKGQEISELIDAMNLSFMLDSGTPVPLCREYTDPSPLLSAIVERFKADKRWEKYDLLFVAPERPLSLWLDTKLITRAVANLVQNCVEHNPAGTTIRLSCSQQPDKSVCVTVEDDGSGMDAATLRNCLKRYYSGGTRTYPGRGVGLTIVKSILDAHGADMTIESRKEQGTRIRLVFPKED